MWNALRYQVCFGIPGASCESRGTGFGVWVNMEEETDKLLSKSYRTSQMWVRINGDNKTFGSDSTGGEES